MHLMYSDTNALTGPRARGLRDLLGRLIVPFNAIPPRTDGVLYGSDIAHHFGWDAHDDTAADGFACFDVCHIRFICDDTYHEHGVRNAAASSLCHRSLACGPVVMYKTRTVVEEVPDDDVDPLDFVRSQLREGEAVFADDRLGESFTQFKILTPFPVADLYHIIEWRNHLGDRDAQRGRVGVSSRVHRENMRREKLREMIAKAKAAYHGCL